MISEDENDPQRKQENVGKKKNARKSRKRPPSPKEPLIRHEPFSTWVLRPIKRSAEKILEQEFGPIFPSSVFWLLAISCRGLRLVCRRGTAADWLENITFIDDPVPKGQII